MKKDIINPPELGTAVNYSQAIAVEGGRTIYISGQVALDADGNLIGDDLETQTTKVFENLKIALNTAGADFANLVKVTFFVVGLKPEKLAIIREVRGKYFAPDALPASSLIGVEALFREDVLIEIEAIAVAEK